jgi:RNA polymerase primary sigma factor
MEANDRFESTASDGLKNLPHQRNTSRGKLTPIEDELPRDYMQKVFSMPLLEREVEREYAEQLKEARQDFAALVITLPSQLRPIILTEGAAGPRTGAKWPLQELEACYERMLKQLPGHEDPRAAGILRQAKRLKRRIESAREPLILSHLRFVVHVVKAVNGYGVPRTDLIQEGTIGLIAAVERFEPERGNRFFTFAYYWIRKAISAALSDKPSVIRIPVHVRRRFRAVTRAARELSGTLGRSPTPQEISGKTKIPVEQIVELMKIAQDARSLESTNEDDPGGILRFVPDTNSPDPLEHALDHELKQKIRAALDLLTPQEELIIRLRFGFGGKERHTLKQIGGILALSRERVRQIERNILEKLQSTKELQGVFHCLTAKD